VAELRRLLTVAAIDLLAMEARLARRSLAADEAAAYVVKRIASRQRSARRDSAPIAASAWRLASASRVTRPNSPGPSPSRRGI
jgi:hypothetical protein